MADHNSSGYTLKSRQEEYLKSEYLDRFLFSGQTWEQLRREASKYGIFPDGYRYAPVCVYIDFRGGFPSLYHCKEMKYAVIKAIYALKDSMNEQFETVSRFLISNSFGMEVELLLALPLDLEEPEAYLEELANRIREMNRDDARAVLTVGLGTFTESPEAVIEINRKVVWALQHRHFSGFGGIIRPEDFTEDLVNGGDNIVPVRQLMLLVRKGYYDTVRETIDRIYEDVMQQANLDLMSCRTVSIAIAAAVFRGFDIAVEDASAAGFREMLLTISRLHTVADMKDYVCGIGYDITFAKRSHGKRRSLLAGKAISYIQEHASQGELKLESVAGELGISIPYLTTLLRRETGKTFGDFVSDCRLNKAKELLGDSDEPISKIAVICGFSSGQYFSTWFRHQTGVTPGAYRSETLYRKHNPNRKHRTDSTPLYQGME